MAASIAVMDEPASPHGPPIIESLFQGIENEGCMRRPAHPPADDPTGIGVDDKGDIDEARPGRDAGEVGDPQHVRRGAVELVVDVVERARCGLVAHRSADRRTMPSRLMAFIKRATVQRATSKPSRRNRRQTLRTP
ncbi:hypothetical protein X726_32530 [Mesorhizobium sp. L103C105A0]|nr:hypothetical protein X726_32530 [Mesorhizobium sp. L103C105A0]